jgi:hypothetical protein
MTNPFSIQNLAPTWAIADVAKASVLKGDTPGHEFHGNQYTGGGKSVLDKAIKIASDRIAGKPNRADALGMADYHRGEATKAMAARDDTGYKDVADNLNKLAKAHLAAEKTWKKVADYGNRNVEADASSAINQTHAAMNHYGNIELNR